MIEKDTIRLLRECDAGAKMGVASINDVMNHVDNPEFRRTLEKSRGEHQTLGNEIAKELDNFMDEGKEPNPMAKGMSWLKTNMKLAMDDSDKTVACLMTDGCNMGVKSLNKYLNEFKAADEKSKDIAKKLINMEQKLSEDIRKYL